MTAIDVSALVGDIPPTTVTVRTFGASTRTTTGGTTASYTDASRSVVVHPSGRRELERRGLDTKREHIAIYDTAALGAADGVRPPWVLYGARWYEVVRVADYAELGGLYLMHAALLDGVTEPSP